MNIFTKKNSVLEHKEIKDKVFRALERIFVKNEVDIVVNNFKMNYDYAYCEFLSKGTPIKGIVYNETNDINGKYGGIKISYTENSPEDIDDVFIFVVSWFCFLHCKKVNGELFYKEQACFDGKDIRNSFTEKLTQDIVTEPLVLEMENDLEKKNILFYLEQMPHLIKLPVYLDGIGCPKCHEMKDFMILKS